MKTLFSTITLCLFLLLNVQAQITTSWTSRQPAFQIPSTATVPSISSLTNASKENFVVDLDGTTYDNATVATAFAAIGAATKTAIDSNWIEDVWGLNPAADIVGRIYITDITRRFDNFEPSDVANQYKAATNIFRVTGRFEWVITP